MRRARRVVLLALVFLLIGAAVNVGVAWLCVWSGLRSVGVQFDSMIHEPWPAPVPADWPDPRRVVWYGGWGLHLREFAFGDGYPSFPGDVRPWPIVYQASIVETGWPLQTLRGIAWSGPHGQTTLEHGWAGAMPLAGFGYAEMLPLTPKMPGFAINTIVYALAATVLFIVPHSTIRFGRTINRRRSSACLSCGYPRAGLAVDVVCPECGKGGGGGGVHKR